VQPAIFPEHILRYRNQRAAASVGLEGLSDDQWVDHFGRFVPIPGSLETPLALRYTGTSSRPTTPTSATAVGSSSRSSRIPKAGS